MKVSFNFGTQKNIDPALLSSVINYLIKEIVAEDGSYTEYVVRGEPYQRKPKNVVSAVTFGHDDEESGERVIDAYVYERYVWMK